MATRLRLLIVAASLAFATQLTLPATIAADSEDLPPGAKLRLGSARMAFPGASTAALLPPNYTTYLAGDGFGGVRRFDASSGQPLEKSGVPSAETEHVVVSFDGKRAATIQSGNLFVHETATGKEFQKLAPAKNVAHPLSYGLASISLSADGKYAARGGQEETGKTNERKGVVLIWEVLPNPEKKGDPKLGIKIEPKRFVVPVNAPVVPRLAPDGKTVAVWISMYHQSNRDEIANRTIHVLDSTTGAERFRVRETGQRVASVAFSPDGAMLVTSAGTGQINVFNAKTGEPIKTLISRSGQGLHITFSPDSKLLASLSQSGSVQTWATSDWASPLTADVPTDLTFLRTIGLGFTEDRRVIAWGSLVGTTASAWEGLTGKRITPVGEHTGTIRSIGFRFGNTLVTSGSEGRIVRWDLTTGKPLVRTKILPANIYTAGAGLPVTLSPDGLLGAEDSLGFGIYDVENGKELFSLPRDNSTRPVGRVLSRDLSRLAMISGSLTSWKSGTCTVWNLVDRRKLVDLPMPGNMRHGVTGAFSPDGTRLITAATVIPYGWLLRPRSPVLRITGWDLATGQKLSEFDHATTDNVTLVAASNSEAIFYGSKERMRILNYETGRLGNEIDKSLGTAPHCPPVFSPDGMRLAAGVYVGNKVGVRLYAWPSCEPLRTYYGHTAPVSALVYSPTGRTLASGSADTTVLLWDLTAK